MTEQDIKNIKLVVIDYLSSIIKDYEIKAEYSTNDDNDINVIVVQEDTGQKVVFYDIDNPLFNYYNVNIYGDSIKSEKDTSVTIGQLIGKSVKLNFNNQTWQIIFMQMSNPRAIEYMDIRRVAYTTTLKCIVNRVA